MIFHHMPSFPIDGAKQPKKSLLEISKQVPTSQRKEDTRSSGTVVSKRSKMVSSMPGSTLAALTKAVALSFQKP